MNTILVRTGKNVKEVEALMAKHLFLVFCKEAARSLLKTLFICTLKNVNLDLIIGMKIFMIYC